MPSKKKPTTRTAVSPEKLPPMPPPLKTPEKKTPEKAIEPQRKLPRVMVQVFIAATGIKADQVRGFTLWVKKERIGSRSIPDWNKEWARYLKRPV